MQALQGYLYGYCEGIDASLNEDIDKDAVVVCVIRNMLVYN